MVAFPGMVIKIEPIDNCIEYLKKKNNYDEIIYLTPDGELLDQKKSNYLSTLKNIIVICGHYKGIDHRVREHIVTKRYPLEIMLFQEVNYLLQFFVTL